MTPLIEEQLEAFFRDHPPPGPVADVGCGTDTAVREAIERAGVAWCGLLDGFDLPFDICEEAPPHRYSTVVSCDLLEHVCDPFPAAANIARSIEPGGWLYVTTVFAFEHHEYPVDMWRFTTTALEYLFVTRNAWPVEIERCWYEDETPHPDMLTRRRVTLVGRRP